MRPRGVLGLLAGLPAGAGAIAGKPGKRRRRGQKRRFLRGAAGRNAPVERWLRAGKRGFISRSAG